MTEHELRARVCARARLWLGRKEADGSHREIIDVYNQIVPLPRGYRLQYSDPWCAGFVSAVAQALGLTAWIFPECGCGPMVELYRKAGRWMEDDAYLPTPGDVIFYDWQDSGVGDNRGNPDHVGLVLEVAGDLITVIEGNCADQVATRTLFLDNRYIRGYGLPDYAAAAIVLTEPDTVGADAPGGQSPAVIVIPDPEPVSDPDTAGAGVPDVPSPAALPEGWCYVALPILAIGDGGENSNLEEAVRAAQLLLKGRGFSVGWMGADGDFGPKTEAALGKFKISRDLSRSPEIDAETWQKLICD